MERYIGLDVHAASTTFVLIGESGKRLGAVVWNAVADWLQRPEMLAHEVQAWRTSREGAAHTERERARLEGSCHHLQNQIDRLIVAYQHGALELEKLKARRERLEAAQEASRARLNHRPRMSINT